MENRTKEIEVREIFCHWEIGTVKGKRGITKSCLLVLTERKTRDELIFKLPDQGAASVVSERLLSIDKIYKKVLDKIR